MGPFMEPETLPVEVIKHFRHQKALMGSANHLIDCFGSTIEIRTIDTELYRNAYVRDDRLLSTEHKILESNLCQYGDEL